MTIYLVFENSEARGKAFIQAHASKRMADQAARDMGQGAFPGVTYSVEPTELLL